MFCLNFSECKLAVQNVNCTEHNLTTCSWHCHYITHLLLIFTGV